MTRMKELADRVVKTPINKNVPHAQEVEETNMRTREERCETTNIWRVEHTSANHKYTQVRLTIEESLRRNVKTPH